MKDNNMMISKLYTVLSSDFSNRRPYLSWRNFSEGDRQRQGLALTDTRYFIAVLDKHILEHTGSVVFTIELTEQYCKLRFYAPLRQKEYDRLAASKYAPCLRSKVYLTVGLGQCGGVPYAYSEVRISQYAGLLDVFDALHTLGRELEKLLKTNML